MNSKKILLIIPDENEVYQHISVKAGAMHLPSLAFAVLAGIAIRDGHQVEILDLTTTENWRTDLRERLTAFTPDYVGLSGTTSIFFHMIEIARLIKEEYPAIDILAGGPHVSSTFEESLEIGCFDYIFIGEGENSFAAFLAGNDPGTIPGVAFKDASGELQYTPESGYLKNLDDYPFPQYELYDLSNYPVSFLHSKQTPVVWLETSRGCPFDCKICNKKVHGQTFRPKSPKRVLAEIKHLHELGVREFHIADDGFTSDMKRAETICDGLIKMDLGFTWSCSNGIRVDRVNQQLLDKMRKAGCYRVSFGIESGNQEVLDLLGKKIKLAQTRAAVDMASKAGIDTFGFFMFGFTNDTPETMMDTIRFAKELPLDLAKASLITPFPGSPLYREYKEMGLLHPAGDYSKYNVYLSPRGVYNHPTLDWDIIEKYQKKFWRSFFFNPRYLVRRFKNDLKNGVLLKSIKVALSVKWF